VETRCLQAYSCGIGAAPSACHAEGRGFESHQPLSRNPLAERVSSFSRAWWPVLGSVPGSAQEASEPERCSALAVQRESEKRHVCAAPRAGVRRDDETRSSPGAPAYTPGRLQGGTHWRGDSRNGGMDGPRFLSHGKARDREPPNRRSADRRSACASGSRAGRVSAVIGRALPLDGGGGTAVGIKDFLACTGERRGWVGIAMQSVALVPSSVTRAGWAHNAIGPVKEIQCAALPSIHV
jgi:hypothetical protein